MTLDEALELVDELTEPQLKEINDYLAEGNTPGKVVKWLLRKLKEWLQE